MCCGTLCVAPMTLRWQLWYSVCSTLFIRTNYNLLINEFSKCSHVGKNCYTKVIVCVYDSTVAVLFDIPSNSFCRTLRTYAKFGYCHDMSSFCLSVTRAVTKQLKGGIVCFHWTLAVIYIYKLWFHLNHGCITCAKIVRWSCLNVCNFTIVEVNQILYCKKLRWRRRISL